MAIDRPWIDRWIESINSDSASHNTGRDFNDSFTLDIGGRRYTLTVVGGRIESVIEDGGPLAV
ncbi:MAG: hypothetical protein ACI9BW_002253, partial [Gammaproteobacteria bacterium]